MNQKGLPTLQGMGDELVQLEDYQTKLRDIIKDRSKFAKITGTITGKAFIGGLNFDFLIRHEVPHLFLAKPTFKRYTEVDEFYRKLSRFSLPDEKKWEKLCELLG